jgi:hypothetical protein
MKPLVDLLVLGESEIRDDWYQRLASRKFTEGLIRPVMKESAARTYRLRFLPGEPTPFAGVVLLLWCKRQIPPRQRALLLGASRFTLPVYVLLCGFEQTSINKKDHAEQALRIELSSLGFQGDEAFILTEEGTLPSAKTLALLLEKLDAQDALLQPPRTPLPFPKEHKEKAKAEVLSSLRSKVRLVSYLRSAPSTIEALFQKPIGSQLGGMPYLEKGEDWPICEVCNLPMCFVWQVDAANVPGPKIVGLYTFYSCEGALHQKQNRILFTVRRYAKPEEAKRQSIRGETTLIFRMTYTPAAVRSLSGSVVALELPNILEETRARPLQKSIKEYEALCQTLCIPQARSPSSSWSVKVGGVTHIDPIACERCGESLASLAVIFPVRAPWVEVRSLRFLVCECEPSLVYTRIERVREARGILLSRNIRSS